MTTYLEQAQTGVWDVPASFLPKVYLDAVTDAGGIVVLLPPQPADRAVADAVLSRLDGLIVSGGADVDPGLYGQVAHPKTGRPRTDRDAWEDVLLTSAIASELPFLGICRGVQLLNVALGGTLVQHLPDVVGDDSYQPGAAVFGPKEVVVDQGSQLAAVLDGVESERLGVQVYHHQAIDRVADGLVVTARTDEGVIEAVELPAVPFGIGVQWHPEEDAADRRLFAGLVDAARRHRDRGGDQPLGQPVEPAADHQLPSTPPPTTDARTTA
ncbi:gamma-glutamyl-gamma-aminobutyrate hydrolase family protein [Plantibacter sp. Mn2098]|uniref:gamma-glutamyl-gamma-aminobutyrate hydrolase family protein n=1 Tax=Plantibacter sp. Mn2098 TaxID=3395266 RepID=UPI003BB9E0FB